MYGKETFLMQSTLFNYGSAARKIMYTTNAIESVNYSLRKVTRKGSFPNENEVLKLLYLRVIELEKKLSHRPNIKLDSCKKSD